MTEYKGSGGEITGGGRLGKTVNTEDCAKIGMDMELWIPDEVERSMFAGS